MGLAHVLRATVFVSLIALLASAGRVGVVVQYNDSVFETLCVEFSGEQTAEGILNSSGLHVEMATFPPWGAAVCGINGVGCTASNCWCDSSNYWAFYYKKNGAWRYSGVGISFPEDNGYKIIQDGGMIGFRWSSWGSSIVNVDFNDVCHSRIRNVGGSDGLRRLELSVNGEKDLAEVVSNGSVAVKVIADGMPVPLVGIRLVKKVKGPLRFGDVLKGVSGFDGSAVFDRLSPGRYLLQAIGYGYIPVEKEVEVVGEQGTDNGDVGAGVKEPVEKKLGIERKESGMRKVKEEANEICDGCTNWNNTGWLSTGWGNVFNRR